MPSKSASRAFVTLLIVGSLAGPLMGQQVDYVLGSQDVFSITVWGPGGMSDRFTVEVDGTFTFPMLGRLKAGGLTVRQLQDDLANRLGDGYFKDPRITVVIEEFRSQRIFIVGEVKSPGAYGLARSMTLVEALTLAGSPTPTASGVALIRRRTDGQASTTPVTGPDSDMSEIRVDLTALQEGVLTDNPILHNGDTIVLPRTGPVYVFGFVSKPGEYTVGKETTVRQVLSLAGGVSPRGAAGRIKIVRVINGTEQEVKTELDDRVRPGDTIVVPERYF